MNDGRPRATVSQLCRELAMAEQALQTPGGGARGNLECRVADLQGRLLMMPAHSPTDVAARLQVAAGMIAGLGPRGYLLDLIETCISDLQAMATAPGEPPAE